MVIEKQWVTEISLFKMHYVFKFIVFYKFTALVITYEKLNLIWNVWVIYGVVTRMAVNVYAVVSLQLQS